MWVNCSMYKKPTHINPDTSSYCNPALNKICALTSLTPSTFLWGISILLWYNHEILGTKPWTPMFWVCVLTSSTSCRKPQTLLKKAPFVSVIGGWLCSMVSTSASASRSLFQHAWHCSWQIALSGKMTENQGVSTNRCFSTFLYPLLCFCVGGREGPPHTSSSSDALPSCRRWETGKQQLIGKRQLLSRWVGTARSWVTSNLFSTIVAS